MTGVSPVESSGLEPLKEPLGGKVNVNQFSTQITFPTTAAGTRLSSIKVEAANTATNLPGLAKASETAPEGSVLRSIGKGIGFIVSLPFRFVGIVVGAVLVAASIVGTVAFGALLLLKGEAMWIFGLLKNQEDVLRYASSSAKLFIIPASIGAGLIEIGLGKNPFREEGDTLVAKVVNMLTPYPAGEAKAEINPPEVASQ